MTTAAEQVNPFAEAMAARTFRASLAKIAVLPSKFPSSDGGTRYQVYVVLVRWPDERNPKAATFSRYISGRRAISTLGASFRRLTGKDPVPEQLDALCPIHLDWEERPQADWRDQQGQYHPSKDQLVPTKKVDDTVPEDVLVECANARVTRTGMEVSEDTGTAGTFGDDVQVKFLEAIVGVKADDVAEKAAEFAEYGPDVVGYIASGQALNQLIMEGKLLVDEATGIVLTPRI